MRSPLGDEFAEEVRRSREETRLGGSIWRQLSGRDPSCGTARALATVRALARRTPPAMRERAATLAGDAAPQAGVVAARARRDIRFKALLDLWLYAHVPLSFALLAALSPHIIVRLLLLGLSGAVRCKVRYLSRHRSGSVSHS